MERPVRPSLLTSAFAENAPHPKILERVVAYLRRLGLQGDDNLWMLAEGCVQRARLRAREHSSEELNRCALEEARRDHDRWLSRALSLSERPTQKELGRARAALLFSGITIDANTWQHTDHLAIAERLSLRAAFPQAIPPEVPLSMPEQVLEFASPQEANEGEKT